ncbi:MAG: NUMOD3 domain-containing DNA-binding protein [Candidatus Berkelbacteria bacterium]|nr:NUMOD3 domain-containing DNA-binding protein [Candidatus Berkelbacteria bacterium]
MAKKEKNERLSEIALKPVEISAELPEKDNVGKKLGLKVSRRFTKPGENVFDTVQWDKRTTTISDEKGNVISQITDVEVPTTWTQLATDILAYKYLRKAGVPTKEGREVSLKQAVYRIAHTIADFGEKFNYFATDEDRVNFEEDLTHILVNQKAAFNSPVWFNCGLYHQYKIAGSGGSFYWDFQQEKVIETKDSYRNPQCSACFILSVEDSLDGIFNLLKTESRVFKFGSGTGANYSRLRSKYERLSGGGTSSGMMSFLKVFDRAADAVKSGGTTRRAAKMVVVDMSHPEIEDFINWKVREEKKVLALIEAGYSTDFNGEAYHTVSGQNSNNSVRITDEFMEAVANDGEWTTRYVGNGEPHKTYKARDLMDQVAKAAWQCADPGVQFDTTVNKWHTCPNTDRINASNPCCITGDTLIAVADGRNAVPIKDLVDTEVPVYSHNHRTGKTTVARMWNIGIKRQNAPIYEVLLDDGTTFRATDDHLIMLRDGSYRMVRDLVAKDSLMPFHSKVLAPAKNRTKRRYFWSGQSWLPQYRAVWQYFNGKQPAGTHIHHQDFSALNDLIDNLLLLSMEDHQAIHRDSMLGDNNPARRLMNDQWRANIAEAVRGEKNGNFGHIHSQETREKMHQQAMLRWSQPEERQKSSENASRWMAAAKAEGRRVGRVPGQRFERCCPICRQNYLTARPEQIFCSVTCKLSPEGIQMYGPKIWEFNRGRHLTETQKAKLSVALKLVSDPIAKGRAAKVAHRNHILRAAKLLIDNNITPDLEDWDNFAEQARRLGASRVPRASIAKQYFINNKQFVEAATLNNHKVVSVNFAGYEHVYDGTVDQHHNFAILTSTTSSCVEGTSNYSGIFIHNSEYMFLDSTSCNLASINLVKFTDDKGNFDVEGYRHACKIMFIAQEIEVDLSSYPTEAITKNSHEYRPLGLGYANLGTMLMLKGVPYDSPEALATAGALSAIMTGHAYKTSAEMAAVKGAFEGFAKNRAPMLNVMKMHRQAAYAINEANCPDNLLVAARQDWDEAVALGEQFGYRNSQATVIAPTGTIGLLLDCDTTGIEPDFALVKFKKLAGGGSMKIVNNAVKQALSNLGYNQDQQQEIIDYALGVGRFIETTPINRSSLSSKGLTPDEIDRVEKTLAAAFDISFSFNRMVLGDDVFDRLGITQEEEKRPSFSLLGKLGFTEDEIFKSNLVVCGSQTLEGAPHLKAEHLPVFDCANRCGPTGTRFIEPLAHVRMMAAVQPFISGAISKTINLPNEATLQDVEQVYAESWKLGLKALALYRDGSKLSQPLNTKKDSVEGQTEVVEKIVEKVIYAPKRRRLPDERRSITHKFQIAGHKGFITVGLYEDGKAGEIFVTMAKQGSTISGLMDAFAKSVSIGLQYGVPLTMVVRQFANSRFEPYGFTTNPQIRIAKSIIDYIARYIGIKFLSPTEQEELGIRADADASSLQTQIDFNEPVVEQPIVNNGSQVDDQASPQLTPTEAEEKSITSPNVQAQTDSPACPNCGSITFKTGTCYTCLSCGSTTGGCS